jgi:uncharacterized membrane protein
LPHSSAGKPHCVHWKVVIVMMGYGNGYTYTNGYGSWTGIFMMFLMIVVVVAIVLLVVWAIRRHDRQHPATSYPMAPVAPAPLTSPQDDPACGAARLRFAKGEISKEELEDICSTLKGK